MRKKSICSAFSNLYANPKLNGLVHCEASILNHVHRHFPSGPEISDFILSAILLLSADWMRPQLVMWDTVRYCTSQLASALTIQTVCVEVTLWLYLYSIADLMQFPVLRGMQSDWVDVKWILMCTFLFTWLLKRKFINTFLSSSDWPTMISRLNGNTQRLLVKHLPCLNFRGSKCVQKFHPQNFNTKPQRCVILIRHFVCSHAHDSINAYWVTWNGFSGLNISLKLLLC